MPKETLPCANIKNLHCAKKETLPCAKKETLSYAARDLLRNQTQPPPSIPNKTPSYAKRDLLLCQKRPTGERATQAAANAGSWTDMSTAAANLVDREHILS